MSKKKSGAPEAGGILLVAQNKKARHDYDIIDCNEAGMVLTGSEVKAIREGGLSLRDSYVKIKDGELFLTSCHISPYSHSLVDAHPPLRERKLLMNRKEINKLEVQLTEKGLTVIPLKVYFKGGKCKIEIGVGRGKKHHDKRQDIKAREAERDIERAFRHRQK